jgi:xanthine dehydrogenase YagS FAD-binding subunit
MIIRDVMPPFELYQPTQLKDAYALLDRFGKDGWKMAGGYDSLSWFKERIKRPKAVIDLSGIAEMKGVRETADGLEIGALTTLTEISTNPIVKAKYRLLADAAVRVASPQIRNNGTIGGNASQDARCTYYRYGLPCYRAGGNACFADTPEGVNREHALFDVDRCVAVSPSDTAPALVALDASFRITGPSGDRTVPASEFFALPTVNAARENVLSDGELLADITLPAAAAGTRSAYHKVMDREAWTHAIVSAAVVARMDGDTCRSARVVLGGVAPIPWRLEAVEQMLAGQKITPDLAARAGEKAVDGARPLQKNRYKVPMTQALVARAIEGLGR